MRHARVFASAAIAVLVALVGHGSLAAPPPSAAPTAAPGHRQILLVATWSTCDRHERDDALAAYLPDEMRRLAETLQADDPRAHVRLIENPPRAAFERILRSNTGPLFAIYSGHGTLVNGRSHLCLSDDNVATEEALTWLAPATPYATFLFNACNSAEIHLPRANLVVLAAGPSPIENRHTETVLGAELLEAARRHLDGDGDGVVDSRELFRALDRVNIGAHPVELKMQSQAWTPLPLFEEPRPNAPAKVLAALSADLEGRERAYRAGAWAPPVDAPPLRWFIPAALDEPGTPRPSTIDRLASADEARVIAAGSLATVIIDLARRRGRLVARDLRTGETIWERDATAADKVTAADREEIVWGYEADGTTRRYRRPIRPAEERSLAETGWRPIHCAQSTGQCFTRALPAGDPR